MPSAATWTRSGITTAWAGMVAFHVREDPGRSFDDLLADEPVLSDKHALLRHFSRDRLLGVQARRSVVAPDLAPFPAA